MVIKPLEHFHQKSSTKLLISNFGNKARKKKISFVVTPKTPCKDRKYHLRQSSDTNVPMKWDKFN